MARDDHSEDPFPSVPGRAPSMLVTKRHLRLAAQRGNVTILLQGESGTGKELIARAVHEASPRAGGPFVVVDVTQIPATLIESVLFGYVRGAFTDAKMDMAGLLERANGGTLFLDEIGDLLLDLQQKFLRTIEARTVRRVGGHADLPLDVRIIAATHRHLRRMVDEGRFRDDLYYRLAVFPIDVPPLRDRLEDIELLVEKLLPTVAAEAQRGVPHLAPEALDAMRVYHWPGNVRELRNALGYAVVLSDGEILRLEHLPRLVLDRAADASSSRSGDKAARLPQAAAASGGRVPPRRRVLLDELSDEELRNVLMRHGWDAAAAATELRVHKSTLYRRLNDRGIVRGR
ncbi:MAG: sigma-54 interaction domain-containing protein [Vicinamibacterales bacterium]